MIVTLSELLRNEGYWVIVTSDIQNKTIRLLDMLWSTYKNHKSVDFVLIDTYSTQNFFYAYFVSQLCRLLNLKYIPILHGSNLPMRLEQNQKLCKMIFKNAYINVSPSHYLKEVFEGFGYNNITYIPNTIEIDNYEFKARDFNSIRLLWVRSFSEIYNPKLAINVLKELINSGINVSLCMVGPDSDGSLSEVKNYAKELNVEVKFTGKLSKKEWINLSKDYTVFLNTTNFDNTPVSVIEAMALGLPVVSTNVGGMPYLISDKKDGLLVNKNDANEMANAINYLIDNQDFAKQIGVNARNTIEQFDWEQVKKLWFNVLLEN